MAYDCVKNVDKEEFDKEVVERVDQGWVLAGKPFVILDGRETVHVQSMTNKSVE